MPGLYSLVFILEIFCLYHAFKNDSAQKWFWLIILLPFIGSLIYLYYHFFNQATVDDVSENINKVVSTNYTLEKLEKEAAFSGTVTNKASLAEEYIHVGEYEKAVFLYTSCLKGAHADDPDLLMGLVKATYLNGDYEAVIKYAQQVENEKAFEKSEERIAYAWALSKTGNKEKAAEIFEDMDHQFSNYKQRFAFCKFLIEEDKAKEAKVKLQKMMIEIEHMDRPEKRSRKTIYSTIKNLYAQI